MLARANIYTQNPRNMLAPKKFFLEVTPMLAHVGPGQLFLDFRLNMLAVEKVGGSPPPEVQKMWLF